MSRSLLIVLTLAMLSGCITLPRDVASELQPVPRDRPDHFHKP
jgi:starvation-inducible outer membrane lipoprotein